VSTPRPNAGARPLARVLLLRLIDPGISEQDATRRRAAMQELTLPDETQTRILHEVAEAFIAAHLLTTNEFAGVRTIEVSHEALIREWARLADWLRDGRDDLRIGLRISADARLWLQRAKPVDLLYRGDVLREAQGWVQRGAPNTDEVEFLQASEAEEQRLAAAEQSRQIKEVKLERRAPGAPVSPTGYWASCSSSRWSSADWSSAKTSNC
jgi:hypothetical protein